MQRTAAARTGQAPFGRYRPRLDAHDPWPFSVTPNPGPVTGSVEQEPKHEQTGKENQQKADVDVLHRRTGSAARRASVGEATEARVGNHIRLYIRGADAIAITARHHDSWMNLCASALAGQRGASPGFERASVPGARWDRRDAFAQINSNRKRRRRHDAPCRSATLGATCDMQHCVRRWSCAPVGP
jgi:hypothetical protein